MGECKPMPMNTPGWHQRASLKNVNSSYSDNGLTDEQTDGRMGGHTVRQREGKRAPTHSNSWHQRAHKEDATSPYDEDGMCMPYGWMDCRTHRGAAGSVWE